MEQGLWVDGGLLYGIPIASKFKPFAIVSMISET
jgi:hypothetical protein